MAALVKIIPYTAQFLPSREERRKKIIKIKPWIEKYEHNVSPTITKRVVGALALHDSALTGLSENAFSIKLAFPSADAAEAKKNYLQAQRIKELVDPTSGELQTGIHGRVYFSALSFVKNVFCQIVAVTETVDVETGYVKSGSNIYPKLFRLDMTFVRIGHADTGKAVKEGFGPGNTDSKKKRKGTTSNSADAASEGRRDQSFEDPVERSGRGSSRGPKIPPIGEARGRRPGT